MKMVVCRRRAADAELEEENCMWNGRMLDLSID